MKHPIDELEQGRGKNSWLMFWAWVAIMAVYALSYVISLPFADKR